MSAKRQLSSAFRAAPCIGGCSITGSKAVDEAARNAARARDAPPCERASLWTAGGDRGALVLVDVERKRQARVDAHRDRRLCLAGWFVRAAANRRAPSADDLQFAGGPARGRFFDPQQ